MIGPLVQVLGMLVPAKSGGYGEECKCDLEGLSRSYALRPSGAWTGHPPALMTPLTPFIEPTEARKKLLKYQKHEI